MKHLILSILLCSCAAAPTRTVTERRALANETINNWSNVSHATASRFIEEYGPPDGFEAGRLTWYNSGPWKRTEVWDAAPYYDTDGGEINLMQTVRHHVPDAKRPELAVFGYSLRISKDGSELSARTGTEALDFLAINLAHQVIEGSMAPDDARRTYDRTAALADAGKTSPYTQRLLFEPEP